MPEQNRVTPTGEVVAVSLRGAWLGNRGVVHGGPGGHEIVRSHTTAAWITCALSFRDRVAPVWEPGRWTALFFHDEAVALSAGHRPCALCRRADFTAYRDAVRRGLDEPALGAPDLDRRLHAERRDRATRRPRRHRMPWAHLPDATFVVVSDADDVPHLVVGGVLVPWSTTGYGAAVRERPRTGEATVLTPPTSVVALVSGYVPQLDPGVASAVTRSRTGVGSGSAQGVTH